MKQYSAPRSYPSVLSLQMICLGLKGVLCLVAGLSEEDRAQGMAVHLVPDLADITGADPPLSDSPVVRSPIDNDDPYAGGYQSYHIPPNSRDF